MTSLPGFAIRWH